jgi:predicted dehydrogenase
MAMNLSEAKRMYSKAMETGLVTQICPSPMGMKGDLFMRRLISEGYLGDIYNVYTRSFSGGNSDPTSPLHWRQVARYSGLNILNMGILVEVVHRWFGHMQTISAQAETFIKNRSAEDGNTTVERPDTVNIMGQMQNGATAAFLFSAVARFGIDSQVEAYGSEGTLIYKLGSDTILGAKAGGEGLKEISIPENEAREWTVEKDFVDAINGGSQGDTSFYDGLKYMEFTEAVARSVERGAVVNLPVVD